MMRASPAPVASACEAPDDARATLERFETSLDPARPAASGAEIVGYGEVSTVFAVPDLPGRLCKRMAGFRDEAAARDYVAVVRRYLACLAEACVRVAPTDVVPLAVGGRRPVVYLLQPRLDPACMGNQLLRSADDAVLRACLDRILAHVCDLARANRARSDGRAVTVDAQLSNWYFEPEGDGVGPPLLVDVGTPFMRLHGVDEVGTGLFLAAVPPLVRAYYRRTRAVERYLDAFFDPRRLLVDLLGNFHKEGRPDRLALAIDHVNRFFAERAADLGVRAILRPDVDRYYANDAAVLELFLRARRLDRFVRTRLLRRPYDFILPGRIRR
jgi:hypothetical protein